MNYYERHLGDYARDTGHLSLLEHGAYTLLLDRYYATEEGIPAAQAYRIARARTTPEREAVDAVLAEFFRRDGDCWRQGRVEAAIAEFQEGDEERAAKRDNAKERQRRTRARRKDLFDQLREAGIVPAWDTATNELERLLSRAPSQPVTPPVTLWPVTGARDGSCDKKGFASSRRSLVLVSHAGLMLCCFSSANRFFRSSRSRSLRRASAVFLSWNSSRDGQASKAFCAMMG